MGVDLKFTMAPADTALPSISSRTCVPRPARRAARGLRGQTATVPRQSCCAGVNNHFLLTAVTGASRMIPALLGIEK